MVDYIVASSHRHLSSLRAQFHPSSSNEQPFPSSPPRRCLPGSPFNDISMHSTLLHDQTHLMNFSSSTLFALIGGVWVSFGLPPPMASFAPPKVAARVAMASYKIVRISICPSSILSLSSSSAAQPSSPELMKILPAHPAHGAPGYGGRPT